MGRVLAIVSSTLATYRSGSRLRERIRPCASTIDTTEPFGSPDGLKHALEPQQVEGEDENADRRAVDAADGVRPRHHGTLGHRSHHERAGRGTARIQALLCTAAWEYRPDRAGAGYRGARPRRRCLLKTTLSKSGWSRTEVHKQPTALRGIQRPDGRILHESRGERVEAVEILVEMIGGDDCHRRRLGLNQGAALGGRAADRPGDGADERDQKQAGAGDDLPSGGCSLRILTNYSRDFSVEEEDRPRPHPRIRAHEARSCRTGRRASRRAADRSNCESTRSRGRDPARVG